jgi:prepilin peptidase CpaA
MNRIKRFLAEEKGLETVEYAIIVGLIVAGLVAIIAAIGTWVKAQFTDPCRPTSAPEPRRDIHESSHAMRNRALLEHPYPAIQWGIVLGASLVAVFTDLRSRRIPNVLTIPMFLLGLVQAFLLGSWGGLSDSLVAGLALALPYVVLYAIAGGGAGDAKLMGAIGAWLGLWKGGLALVSVALCGVALALLVARVRHDLPRLNQWIATMLRSVVLDLSARRLPTGVDLGTGEVPDSKKIAYAPAIGLGVLFACTSWYLWHA